MYYKKISSTIIVPSTNMYEMHLMAICTKTTKIFIIFSKKKPKSDKTNNATSTKRK